MTPLLRRLNEAVSRRFGLRAVRTGALYPWQLSPGVAGSFNPAPLPEAAISQLRPDHPRLVELEARYAAMDERVTAPATWRRGRLTGDDLAYFRGDNAFVWQVRGRNQNILSYALCYYHFAASDREGLLARLDEDDSFGIHLFEIDGRLVSRDLVDSAREIQFLQRHLGIGSGPANILDVGAGYGRLAWRLDQAFGGKVRVFATDAFAPSTFICEHYLRFRDARNAVAVPLDEVEDLLGATPIHLAVNVHSFSECKPEAVAWWLERLAAHKVRYLLVVPNAGTSGGGICQDRDGASIETIFARFGYRPKVREPRYSDPLVQEYGIDPVWLHLFELALPA